MLISDLISYASTHLLHKSLSDDDALPWINDALDRLGVDARLLAEQTFTAAARAWNPLPGDCLKVCRVTDASGYDCYSWEADHSRIRFLQSGAYNVAYYRAPTPATAVTQEPDCPAALHQALAYYLAYRFESRMFPGAGHTLAWLAEFDQRLALFKHSAPGRNRTIKVGR